MRINLPKNIAIAISSIIICLGIAGYSYAQFSNAEKIKEAKELENSQPYIGTTITGEAAGGKLILKWIAVDHPKFSGYKVVISKSNPNPKYPNDGYLFYITDKNVTTAVVDNSDTYKSGDFGDKLTQGEKYYFSITVVYDGKTIPGDAIQLIYPGKVDAAPAPVPVPEAAPAPVPEPVQAPTPTLVPAPGPAPAPQPDPYPVPKVTAYQDGNKVMVKWNAISSSVLQGYKVVISKNNPNPVYSQDGYLAWITNKNTTQWTVDNTSGYNGGDVGGYLVPGQAYYFSVTAVYNDRKIAGNAVKVTYPSGASPGKQVVLTPVAITAIPSSGSKLYLTWPSAPTYGFSGYKVVISKNNPNPQYPTDGYLSPFITNNTQTATFVNADTYYGGDINGKLVPGQAYYFSITVLYGSTPVKGPAVQAILPLQ